MKITIKAVLININEKQKQAIDELMVAFCSAARFSFKRLLEGVKKGEIEKDVSFKYGLNIRQSKDAVENARQTIVSQKELTKMNYENVQRKVKSTEAELEKQNLSERKRKALISKLDKRKGRLIYLESFINSNKTLPVVFGTRELFIKRCKGLIAHEEWVYEYKEKIPKILKDIFIKEKNDFINQNEWKRWAIINNNINKNIEGKEVNKPDFWIENRKEILRGKLLSCY